MASKAVEFYDNYERGILPRSGGWLDQDPQDVYLINLASSIYAERKRIADQNRERKTVQRKR